MATLATFGLNVTLGDGDRFCLRETDVFVLAEAKIVQAAQRDGGDPGGLRNVAVASRDNCGHVIVPSVATRFLERGPVCLWC